MILLWFMGNINVQGQKQVEKNHVRKSVNQLSVKVIIYLQGIIWNL